MVMARSGDDVEGNDAIPVVTGRSRPNSFQIGVVLADGSWPEIVDAARVADSGGIDAIGFWDHYHSVSPDFAPHNGWAVYGFLASATRNTRLCPLVLDGPNYSIGRLAKESAMLSILSRGRFELGIGVGDVPEEEAAWGQPPYLDGATRIDWLEETVAALRLSWTGGLVDFSGAHIRLRGARCTPPPDDPPRIVVGAGGSSQLARRAAGFADEINVYNRPATIESAQAAIAGSGRSVSLSVCVDQFDDFGDHVPGRLDDHLGHWQGSGVDRLFITIYAPYTFLPLLVDAITTLRQRQ